MLYLDTTLSKSFRFYDAQIKWLAPGGLTINQLADALYAQWLKHEDIKRRKGVAVSRDSALQTIVKYIQMVFSESVGDYNMPVQQQQVQVRRSSRVADVPRKRRKCCGG